MRTRLLQNLGVYAAVAVSLTCLQLRHQTRTSLPNDAFGLHLQYTEQTYVPQIAFITIEYTLEEGSQGFLPNATEDS